MHDPTRYSFFLREGSSFSGSIEAGLIAVNRDLETTTSLNNKCVLWVRLFCSTSFSLDTPQGTFTLGAMAILTENLRAKYPVRRCLRTSMLSGLPTLVA